MAASDPPVVGHRSMITTVLDSDIETIAAFKDSFETTLLKEVFESVIAILGLVRVRFLVLFLFSDRLIGDTTRTR